MLSDSPKKKKQTNARSLANLKPNYEGRVTNPHGDKLIAFRMAHHRLTVKYLEEIIELCAIGNVASVKEIIEDPNEPAVKVGLAQCMVNSVEKGDWDQIEKIISRILGKIPENINLNLTVEEKQAKEIRIMEKAKKLVELNGR